MAASKPKSTTAAAAPPATQPEGTAPAGAAQAPETASAPADPASDAPAGQEPPASAPSGGAGVGNDHLVPVGDMRSDGQVQTPELLGQATDAWMATQAAISSTPIPSSDPPPPVVDDAPPAPELALAEPPPALPSEPRVPVGWLEETDTRFPGTAGRHEVDSELVTVFAPNGFTLTLDDGTPVFFKQGRNENVQRAHAQHWYCAAQGVRAVQDGE